jgi:hypothetical protein
MALVGALIGSKDTLLTTWYGPFVEIASHTLGGGIVGFILGFLLSLRLPRKPTEPSQK